VGWGVRVEGSSAFLKKSAQKTFGFIGAGAVLAARFEEGYVVCFA
jgi:hypothetical protein